MNTPQESQSDGERDHIAITIEDRTIDIELPLEFGYFPRHKYKDLVFYVKTGKPPARSNCGLFEMPDTEGNRMLMDALSSRPASQQPLGTHTQPELHTIDLITLDLIDWLKKARPEYQFGTDPEWDALIERVTGYRTEEGANNIRERIERRLTSPAKKELLDLLDKEISIREREMYRKGNLEDNLTTATEYLTASSALNWVRAVLITAAYKNMQKTEDAP